MLSLKAFPYLHPPIAPLKSLFPSSFSAPFPPPRLPTRRFLPLRLVPASSFSLSTAASSSAEDMTPISTAEHVVLFKVRDSTDPSKVDAMISNLRSLVSLDLATYLTAGSILRPRSAAADAFGFTHLLFSRYRSKADLATYSAHPAHLAVVKENVFPICDDVMAVDWISDVDVGVTPFPGSLLRIALAKPREGAAAAELVKAIDGVRVSVPGSVQVSYGENISPERAKGYEVGFVCVFPGQDEADAIEGQEEVKKQKEKIKPLLESAIVVDYLVPSSSSSLSDCSSSKALLYLMKLQY